MRPVVHPGPLERLFAQAEAQGLDEVQALVPVATQVLPMLPLYWPESPAHAVRYSVLAISYPFSISRPRKILSAHPEKGVPDSGSAHRCTEAGHFPQLPFRSLPRDLSVKKFLLIFSPSAHPRRTAPSDSSLYGFTSSLSQDLSFPRTGHPRYAPKSRSGSLRHLPQAAQNTACADHIWHGYPP